MKLLVFDLGHVLIDFEWMKVCYAFSERCQQPSHRILEAFSVVGKLGYETGKVSTQEFLRELNRLLESDINLAEFNKLWNTSFRENSEMASLLGELKVRHKLSMLSNTNESHYQFIQSSFNVERHFDSRILSYEVGFAKPKAEIYERVFSEAEVKAEDCLFVDDLKVNTEAAQDLGMQAIQYTDIESLKMALFDYGIKSI